MSRAGPTAPGVIPAGAGGVVGFEDYGGISGGSDYHRANQTSMLASFSPDTLAVNVRGSWDEPWAQEITPQKPMAVSMVGSDVFASTPFIPSVRNQLHDLRGEAAVNPQGSDVPEGASAVGWRSYAADNGPSSTGSACGTCNASYSRSSTAQASASRANRPRTAAAGASYRTPMAKLKAAFFL